MKAMANVFLYVLNCLHRNKICSCLKFCLTFKKLKFEFIIPANSLQCYRLLRMLDFRLDCKLNMF